MVSLALAAVGLLQLLAIFVTDRSTVLRRLAQRTFLQAKDPFGGISDLFGDIWSAGSPTQRPAAGTRRAARHDALSVG
jgi:hypothetical protein